MKSRKQFDFCIATSQIQSRLLLRNVHIAFMQSQNTAAAFNGGLKKTLIFHSFYGLMERKQAFTRRQNSFK